MAIKKVFKATIPSCQYFFKDGQQAAFIDHKFMTDVESQIAELTAEIGQPGAGKSKHPHLFIDLDESEVDTEAMSPIDIIKAQVRQELLAEMRLAATADRDMGTTAKTDPTAGMSNSKTVAEAMAGSDSSAASSTSSASASPSAPTTGVAAGSIKVANTSPQ